jgi:hypothetical protein
MLLELTQCQPIDRSNLTPKIISTVPQFGILVRDDFVFAIQPSLNFAWRIRAKLTVLLAIPTAKVTLSEDAIICKFFATDRLFQSIFEPTKLRSKLCKYRR